MNRNRWCWYKSKSSNREDAKSAKWFKGKENIEPRREEGFFGTDFTDYTVFLDRIHRINWIFLFAFVISGRRHNGVGIEVRRAWP